MSAIILPGRPGWFGMVSPREEEMPEFLKVIAQGWRTPKRKWEDLWRLRRGELNHVLGMRQFGSLKLQRGSVGARVQAAAAQQGAGPGTIPDVSDITNLFQQVAPAIARQSVWYESDGTIQWDEVSGGLASIVYAQLTTQTDDANNHTLEWWPDNPETNEGLNWDIRYTNLTEGGTPTATHYFEDPADSGLDRDENVWYLLDTVSNDGGDATDDGAIGLNRNNGTAKSPSTGIADIVVDIQFRPTGSGGQIATHTVDLTVEGT
jgi:hypothetical protein